MTIGIKLFLLLPSVFIVEFYGCDLFLSPRFLSLLALTVSNSGWYNFLWSEFFLIEQWLSSSHLWSTSWTGSVTSCDKGLAGHLQMSPGLKLLKWFLQTSLAVMYTHSLYDKRKTTFNSNRVAFNLFIFQKETPITVCTRYLSEFNYKIERLVCSRSP